MAKKSITIGNLTNFHVYDDTGITDAAIFPDVVQVQAAPAGSNDVLRLGDVGGGGPVAPYDAQYVVIALDGDLDNERRLQVDSPITLTDNGANNDVDIGFDTTVDLILSANLEVGSSDGLYFGDQSTDGSWRIIRSGNDLVIERRESSSWVTKSTISA